MNLPLGGIGGALFGSSSVYAQRVDSARVAGNSGATVRLIDAASRSGEPGVNLTAWNMPLYHATRSTPRSTVTFSNCLGGSSEVPAEFANAMRSVPIPAGAKPSDDADAHLAIYDSSTDQLWELWRAEKGANGSMAACWGGRIDAVSKASGRFSGSSGATASGLSMIGTQITQAEVRAGRIDHAIGIVLPSVRAGRLSYPAQRTDGTSSDSNAPMQGQRFRLDPSLDVDALHLTPLATMIAKAGQTYGFICINSGGGISMIAESPLPAQTVGKPNPWPAIMGARPRGDYRGKDWFQLEGFPWSRLQAIEPNWRG
ncbi:MAG: hypothetical protein ACK5MP_11370 [Nostocoides sp.]